MSQRHIVCEKPLFSISNTCGRKAKLYVRAFLIVFVPIRVEDGGLTGLKQSPFPYIKDRKRIRVDVWSVVSFVFDVLLNVKLKVGHFVDLILTGSLLYFLIRRVTANN